MLSWFLWTTRTILRICSILRNTSSSWSRTSNNKDSLDTCCRATGGTFGLLCSMTKFGRFKLRGLKKLFDLCGIAGLSETTRSGDRCWSMPGIGNIEEDWYFHTISSPWRGEQVSRGRQRLPGSFSFQLLRVLACDFCSLIDLELVPVGCLHLAEQF